MTQTYQQFLKSLPPKERKKHKAEWQCPSPKCKNACTWWLCRKCGSSGCREHQRFTGMVVSRCWKCSKGKPMYAKNDRLFRIKEDF